MSIVRLIPQDIPLCHDIIWLLFMELHKLYVHNFHVQLIWTFVCCLLFYWSKQQKWVYNTLTVGRHKHRSTTGCEHKICKVRLICRIHFPIFMIPSVKNSWYYAISIWIWCIFLLQSCRTDDKETLSLPLKYRIYIFGHIWM